LPPGIAMVSFEVERLPEGPSSGAGPAERIASLPYAGRRACICVGPAGELIELIEAD
jgi:hypothetical protein